MTDIVERLRDGLAFADRTEAANTIDALRAQVAALERSILDALPSSCYMDPPDGGDVDLPEQLRRMSQDAKRYRKWRTDYTGIFSSDMLSALADAWEPEQVDAAIDAAMKS